MSDVFLSYARKDRNRVGPIVAQIEGRGWSVWWDPKILPGQHWPDVIEEALRDCRAVVVVWTRQSVKSRWVRLEAGEGAKIDGLIPIQLDETECPIEFRHIQAADFTDWDGESQHSEVASAMAALDGILRKVPGADSNLEPPRTLGSDTDLPISLSLSLGGDLGSTDPRDQKWIDSQVRSAGKRAVPALLAALEFPEPERRGHAAYLLGLTGDAEVVNELTPLLSDRSAVDIVEWLPTVRTAAALALRNIGTFEALQSLADAFE